MVNEVQMMEPLGFGRFANFTGAQMLERQDAIEYLVWIYNCTDISMDGRVVAELVKHGLVSVSLQRKNSKDCSVRFDRNPDRKARAQQAFKLFQQNRHTIKDESSGDRLAKMITKSPLHSYLVQEMRVVSK